MKFLYKIYSGYDGFTPSDLPNRKDDEGHITLGWRRYLDEVELGDEVWVYFFGPGTGQAGIYVKGRIAEIDRAAYEVVLSPRTTSTSKPLTDAETSRRIAEVVAARGLQVFLVPETWSRDRPCDVEAAATTCAARQCEDCPAWEELRRIGLRSYWEPSRLTGFDAYVPAYWVLVRRGKWGRSRVRDAVVKASDLFYRFKTGEKALSFPLALGMYRALLDRGLTDFDAIVPIPLSPDKVAGKELNRALALARELGRLMGVPVSNCLSLTGPISKRRMLLAGQSASAFQSAYGELLRVRRPPRAASRILIVDDVGTWGLTLSAALDALRDAGVEADAVAATAGLMLTKSVVAKEAAILRATG